MKYSHTRFITFTIGAVAAGLSTAFADSHRPTVITPPAVKDGSNWSRAPFAAARQFDDVKPADGRAIDQTGANSPVANIEPAVPVARVAVLQPAQAPTVLIAQAPATVIVSDPVLTPTGRSSMALAMSFDAAALAPTIRSTTMSSRDHVLADIEMRHSNGEKAIDSFRSTHSKMMSAEGRRQFNAAEEVAKEKAKALKKSIKAAKKANDAEWDSSRMQLASDYEAYAAAIAQLDTASSH